jgi:hypothetical protein
MALGLSVAVPLDLGVPGLDDVVVVAEQMAPLVQGWG